MIARDELGALLERVKVAQAGFLSAGDLANLARLDRLRPVLIRWHEGRATVAAQDAAPIMAACTEWTVRDVSLPATDPVYPGAARRA